MKTLFFILLFCASSMVNAETLPLQVGASADDCRQSFGVFNYTDTWVNGPGWSSGDGFFDQGYRFTSVTVPVGATIISAKLSLFNRDTETSAKSYDLSAEDVDNSSDFSADDVTSFQAKVRTTASVSISIPSGERTANTWYEDTGLESVIQEIVDRGGWASGNSITIIADGTTTHNGKDFQVAHWDQSPSNAPKLEIIYTTDGAPAPSTRRRKVILGG